jgi:hypothetical protein
MAVQPKVRLHVQHALHGSMGILHPSYGPTPKTRKSMGPKTDPRPSVSCCYIADGADE